MSIKARHYNESTLHVMSGIARQDQLEAALKAVFKQIRDHYPDDGYEKAYFLANVISDTKGIIFGYAYIWVSDPRIYYMLIGRDPDGAERYEEYDDPDWVEPTQERPQVSSVNWADITEEEEELDEKYTRPMIRKELPPLVRLPGCRYDEEQLKRATEIVRSKALPDQDPSKIVVPTIGYFEVSRAWVGDISNEDSETTLCCRRAPGWVDKDMLRPFFERYSTDRSLRYGTIEGVKCNYTFPVITLSKKIDHHTGEENKIIYVSYSTLCPHDASFALLMTRKFMIENLADIRRNEKLLSEGKPILEVRKTLLIFSHWRKTPVQHQAAPKASNPPVRTAPTVGLTTAPKIAPPAIARVSGVTGNVTAWIQPPANPPK